MSRSAVMAVATLLFAVPGVAVAQSDEPAPAPASQPPAPGSAPPSHYYVEPAPGPAAPQGGQRPQGGPPPQGPPPAAPYEPPPPGYYGQQPVAVYEPPPPPKPKHRAPRESLWIGARVGWFIPFGDLWGVCTDNLTTGRRTCDIAAWRDFASSGSMFELDIGARISRRNNLFFLWEHASLGRGSKHVNDNGGQEFGETNYYALGIRHSSNPSTVGFVSELGIGYRTFKAHWEDGTELSLSSFPLELRIALGADFRIASMFSLSPLVSIGGGAFTDAELEGPNTSGIEGRTNADSSGTHSWVTFQLGGHFDLFGSK